MPRRKLRQSPANYAEQPNLYLTPKIELRWRLKRPEPGTLLNGILYHANGAIAGKVVLQIKDGDLWKDVEFT